MLKLALLVPVVFALGTLGTGTPVTGPVAVEGATPVSLGKKKGTAYPVTCAAPIKFTASGPASLIVDVRGASDASDLGLSFRLAKKPVKTGFAAAEVAVEPPKPAEPAKVAADAKPADAAAPATPAAPAPAAYVGLFTPISY